MIVPMKKATVYALSDDKTLLLTTLQRHSIIMIIGDGETTGTDINRQRNDTSFSKALEALAFAGEFTQKTPMLEKKPLMDFDWLISQNESDDRIVKQLLEIKNDIIAAESRVQELNALNNLLSPWLELDLPLNGIIDTRYAKVAVGYISDKADLFKQKIENLDGVAEIFGAGSSGTAVIIIYHRSMENEIMEAAQNSGFIESELPKSEMSAAELFDRNTAEINECERTITDMKTEAARLAEEDIKALQRLRDKEATDLARDNVRYDATEKVFYVTGWIRSDHEDRLRKLIEQVTEYFFLEINAPADDETPPTVTKNNKFITQFETITDSFSRPGARDVLDPNPVMGLWYWLFFGMMMGDAGYGLVMLIFIGGYKLLSKSKVKLINVLFYSSFTTIFWGIMFGSYFGMSSNEISWLPSPALLSPLDNIMISMGICLGIGALHMFCGMIMKAVIDFRHGRPWDGIFDQISWIILIIGLPMFFIESLRIAGIIMVVFGAAVILFTAGRSNPKVLGKITGGLLGLYGVTSYLSDILSYARILALMLSGGIVAMVMNILGGMVMPGPGAGIAGIIIGGIFGVAIYIVGHVFNLALALLSAYVHDSRLQYLEFFGKFYDGGGYAFTPLSPDIKYVELEDGVGAG